MTLHLRPFLICLLAYVAALVLTSIALAAMVDLSVVSLQTVMPREAALTPMIAVVVFWAVSRVMGVPLAPAQTFLIGAIVIYGILFFMGRIVVWTPVNSSLATLVAALLLFVACYMGTVWAIRREADPS